MGAAAMAVQAVLGVLGVMADTWVMDEEVVLAVTVVVAVMAI
jgi:hypothetical protein